jgi:hypothetical protein
MGTVQDLELFIALARSWVDLWHACGKRQQARAWFRTIPPRQVLGILGLAFWRIIASPVLEAGQAEPM